MNLFGDLVSNLAGGATTGAGGQGLVASVLEMLSNRQGGIAGLAETFQQKGLGDIVSSWIGTGANLPVSAAQIQQVLGSEQVEALARKMGVSPEAAGSQLAGMLPGIVDKLTPDGEASTGGDLMAAGMGLLKSLMPDGGAK